MIILLMDLLMDILMDINLQCILEQNQLFVLLFVEHPFVRG